MNEIQPGEVRQLEQLAEASGRLAGLRASQIPGLAELFRVVWLAGYRAARRDFSAFGVPQEPTL